MSKITKSQKSDWMQTRWRPMMAIMYMIICSFDFIIAPLLWSIIQALAHGQVNNQWQPLTLQGAGLFHLAMGAILGIAAHGRTQEKLNGVSTFGQGAGTTYIPPTQNSSPISSPIVTAPITSNVISGYAGKLGPKPTSDPIL